jgi:hypothetical protein
MEIARQAWLTLEAQFLDNRESHVLQLDTRLSSSKATATSTTTIAG